jgi:hypothetical protein
MNTKTAAIVIGLAFAAVGLLGFVANPIIGESSDAIFHTDKVHNIVHIISGVLFLVVAFAAPGFTSAFLKIFGIVYLALGIYGMVTIGSDESTKLLGFLHVTKAINYLHLGLGVIIFLAGVMRPATAKAS